MQGKGAGAVNRVELECQVLCAALRQSWVRRDKVGAFTSIRELSHLFPDLLPPPEEKVGSNKANYYEVLGVRPQSGLNSIVVGYLRTVRKFLKQYNPKDHRQFYNTMLNAGFVLRKPRLRLSHDLVVARRWLYESQDQDDEQLGDEEAVATQPTPALTPEPPDASAEAASQGAVSSVSEQADFSAPPSTDMSQADAIAGSNPPLPEQVSAPPAGQAQAWGQSESGIPQSATPEQGAPVTPPQTVSSGAEARNDQATPHAVSHEPAPEFKFDEKQLRKPEVEVDLPAVIRLMEASHLISRLEVQALKAQMVLAPNIPAEQLVINAGYATRTEIASLKLAQDLLSSGKITMAQFQVAMYDERTSGLRMAESLQVRGWLETEVKNPIEELKKQ